MSVSVQQVFVVACVANAMWDADASAAAQLHTYKHSLSVRNASGMRDADATAAAQLRTYTHKHVCWRLTNYDNHGLASTRGRHPSATHVLTDGQFTKDQ